MTPKEAQKQTLIDMIQDDERLGLYDKQTAVEWLANELYEKFEMKGDGNLFDKILKQAKEMEKEQIIEAYKTFLDTTLPDNVYEEYYNETFKND